MAVKIIFLGRFQVGQNLYTSGTTADEFPVDWQKAIDAWYNEVAQVNGATSSVQNYK